MSGKREDRIVWIDLEMTGLDMEKDLILEVACLISDSDLNIVSDEFNVIINQPDAILENMNEWCMNQHVITGLIEDCRSSKIKLEDAQQMLLAFLMKYIPEKTCPLAGSTIYMDRIFLRKLMPVVDDYIHYRIIDVSSIKELVKRWNPNAYKCKPDKVLNHRAMSDIKESMQELKYYKENIFKCSVL